MEQSRRPTVVFLDSALPIHYINALGLAVSGGEWMLTFGGITPIQFLAWEKEWQSPISVPVTFRCMVPYPQLRQLAQSIIDLGEQSKAAPQHLTTKEEAKDE